LSFKTVFQNLQNLNFSNQFSSPMSLSQNEHMRLLCVPMGNGC